MTRPCEMEAVRWAAIDALDTELDTVAGPQEIEIYGPYRKLFRYACLATCKAFPDCEVEVFIDRAGLPYKAVVYTE